jgi:ankyrin repeat protein
MRGMYLSFLLVLPAGAQPVDFLRDVEPILSRNCYSCHGDDAQQAGLRLNRRQNAMRGSDYGPVIVPGNAGASKLIRRLVNGDGGMMMPPGVALEPGEIAVLRAWIDQGADWRMEVKEDPAPRAVAPQVRAFLHLVRAGDVARVRKELARDAVLGKAADADGSTALHQAAGFGSMAVMTLLLEKGADVNAANRRGSTPLHWGIHDAGKVRLLLESGAKANAIQAEGRTPLFQAAVTGNGVAAMELLLAKGADANAATAAGLTPLMAASGRGDTAAMELLLRHKARVNARSGSGATALIAAAGSGKPEAVRLLLKHGADPKIADKKNDSALGAAATAGAEASVRMLVDKGAPVNLRDHRGYSPLHYAAASDAMPAGIVKFLLEKGADTSLVAENETAATLAAKRGDTAVTRILGGIPAAARHEKAAPRETGESVEKALGLLAAQSANFIRIGGCNSCHAQDLPSAAAAAARARGLRAPTSIPQLSDLMNGGTAARTMDFNVIGVASIAWQLFDKGMNGSAADEYTDAIVRYLVAMQTPAGNWHAPQGRRPPMNAGEYQAAALAIYAMRQYAPAGMRGDAARAVARAAAWLERQEPANTQDRAFQLLGLHWAGAGQAAIQRAGKALAAMQGESGGWSQLPTMPADAYATGQAVYALQEAARLSPAAAAVARGVRWLRETQRGDGSWHVPTRSIWFQPYFESGFPYGHDQWISAAGTAWATMALALTHEPQRMTKR